MHIQDGGMHADENKSIYFENQARYGIVKEIYILNVLSNKTNFIYITIPFKR